MPPASPDNPITYFARTDFRNDRKLFGIRQTDRRSHLYILGKTGTGKSTLLETFMRQDLEHGNGFALLDPHGDLVERVARHARELCPDRLIYWDVADTTRPLGFNPLERIPKERRSLAASGLLEVFKKLWIESWGPRLEHILRNCLLALLDQPEATLADILRLLDDKTFRKGVVDRVAAAQVRNYWLREYERYSERFRVEAIAPIQNKGGAFLADPVLHRIITAPRSAFDLRRVMDEGKILLVNLAKGRIGEDSSSLLGALIVSRLGLAALERADQPEEERRDFYLYLDEFQNFSNLSLATMLSELRKYRLNLILSHQYLTQVDERVRDAILGNVGTIICFRLGMADAEVMAKEFWPDFTEADFVNLPNYRIYLRLMIDGRVSKGFSGETIQM
ncbi:type IV secretory system conjugative DNA transfer family protein [Candidatus Sumerlaeota bacterium]|nr:type IV secretory system conjugative DNA transfer family protein [Candidatus Sumerlaeota bacterium]